VREMVPSLQRFRSALLGTPEIQGQTGRN